MDALRDFLDAFRRQAPPGRNFLGMLNVMIGSRLVKADGTLVSAGMTWRQVALLLKRFRWDKEAVRELGLDPATLPPRDRERFWYAAIAHARVDSEQADLAGDDLAVRLQKAGYIVSPGLRSH